MELVENEMMGRKKERNWKEREKDWKRWREKRMKDYRDRKEDRTEMKLVSTKGRFVWFEKKKRKEDHHFTQSDDELFTYFVTLSFFLFLPCFSLLKNEWREGEVKEGKKRFTSFTLAEKHAIIRLDASQNWCYWRWVERKRERRESLTGSKHSSLGLSFFLAPSFYFSSFKEKGRRTVLLRFPSSSHEDDDDPDNKSWKQIKR